MDPLKNEAIERNCGIFQIKNYLNEGHPTLMTVKKIATQWCCQLASVNVVGELWDIFEKDFLQIKSALTLKHSKLSVHHVRFIHLKRGRVTLGRSQDFKQQLDNVLLFGLDYIQTVDSPNMQLENKRRAENIASFSIFLYEEWNKQ